MSIFSLEHSPGVYRADFVLHGAAIVALAGWLVFAGPREHWGAIVACVVIGLAAWTAIEYVVHRFVLHGLRPFSRWHAAHHARPAALIGAPTILSAALTGALVFLPALLLGNAWFACALTLGVLAGYMAYGVTHHATHHWRAGSAWSRRNKRRHALHHHPGENPGWYGVTSAFWDHVFGSSRLTGHDAK